MIDPRALQQGERFETDSPTSAASASQLRCSSWLLPCEDLAALSAPVTG